MPQTSVVVVGAGAFGGWTALHLLRNGAKVTLFDPWGPGNSRSSSGDETRIIRSTYGSSLLYTRMALDALRLWQENEARWRQRLFVPTGVLWMAAPNDEYEQASLRTLEKAGAVFEKLSQDECTRRWPQIDFHDVRWSIFEPNSGYLLARRSCEVVMQAFLAEGGDYRQASATPNEISGKEMTGVLLNKREILRADRYVFACGPWLPQLFPFLIGKIRPTRQEVFYFGTPANDPQFSDGEIPTWIDLSANAFYGIPGNQWRGFKVACDQRGPEFDPTSGERRVSDEGLATARAYMEHRFPAMRGAPLVDSRVCQYEQSLDGNFILDRHPDAENVWILGGGSGHGFKHGPAFGLKAARTVLEIDAPEAELTLGRSGSIKF
jgi:glycine/D-amino acid oxidase-like deaminating enzyme